MCSCRGLKETSRMRKQLTAVKFQPIVLTGDAAGGIGNHNQRIGEQPDYVIQALSDLNEYLFFEGYGQQQIRFGFDMVPRRDDTPTKTQRAIDQELRQVYKDKQQTLPRSVASLQEAIVVHDQDTTLDELVNLAKAIQKVNQHPNMDWTLKAPRPPFQEKGFSVLKKEEKPPGDENILDYPTAKEK